MNDDIHVMRAQIQGLTQDISRLNVELTTAREKLEWHEDTLISLPSKFRRLVMDLVKESKYWESDNGPIQHVKSMEDEE